MFYLVTIIITIFLILSNNFLEIYSTIPFIKKSEKLKRYVKLKKHKRKNSNAINKIFLINFIFYVAYLIFYTLYVNHIIDPGVVHVFLKFTRMPIMWNKFVTAPWSLMTNIFAHLTVPHFLMNMLVLYYITPYIRDYFNNSKIWTIYILGGVFGSLLCMFIYSTSPNITLVYFSHPYAVSPYATLIGASVSIFALFTAITYKNPNKTFKLFFFRTRIKFIYVYFLLNTLISLLYGINAGGQLAHIGGVLVAVWIMEQYNNSNSLLSKLDSYLNKHKI
jgi:membrane associated rhomboid family serine protease